jgi:hypothetical protein
MPGDGSGPPDESPGKYPELSRESASPSTPTRASRSLLPYAVLVVVTFFVTWFVFATITGLPVGLGPSPTSKSPSGTSETGVVLTINNPFDTARNLTADQFAPANFSVPAHTELEFTMINYDTGQNPGNIPGYEGNVNGTVGNCIYLNATPTDLGPCVHSVNNGFITHTFSIVNGTYAGFNIPLPSAIDSPQGGIGASVTFFAYFNVTGTFYWHCEAPCDPWSMLTDGFMGGTMTVVAP